MSEKVVVVEFSESEARLLLAALDKTPVSGLEAMNKLLAVAAKVHGSLERGLKLEPPAKPA